MSSVCGVILSWYNVNHTMMPIHVSMCCLTSLTHCYYRSTEPAMGEDEILSECIKSLPTISNTYISLALPMGEQLLLSRSVSNI